MGFLRLLRFAARRHLSSTSASPPTPNTNLDPKHITAAIKSLYKERDIDRFLSCFRHLSATSPLFRTRYDIYEVAVRRLADARRFEDVGDIVEFRHSHSDEFASRDGFAAEIISLYGKAGMTDRASEAFHQLPAPRGVVPFTAYLAALGDPDRVVREFRSVTEEDPEVVPDVVSYGTVIRALCEKGDLDTAMGMLEEMEEKGVQPNVVVFNTLLNAFYKSDRSDDAEKIWAKMSEKSCEPNVRTFNAKLRWLNSVGRTSEGVELFNEMEGRGIKPDGYSFTALIVGYCKEGKLKKAKKMYAELQKKGCDPTPGTYEALLPQICEAGDFELAISLCKESMDRKCFINVDALHSVMSWLVKFSRLQDAKNLVETGWCRHYSKERLPMPAACLSWQSELKNENEEGKVLGEEASLFNKLSDDVPRDANPQEASEKGLSAKIGIIVKSFEKPKYFGAFGVPTDKNRVKLPTTRTLITVLRSPHIDKKSREQFEIKIRREYIMIKCQPHELHKKYFWFKRTRVLGAQFELVFSYKTRLDMSRLKASM